MNTALETYRISRAAFTNNGIPTDAEIDEHLQREVNQELGTK